MDMITLTMPKHSVKYLCMLCEEERARLARILASNFPSIASEASFDSLDGIESSIPSEIFDE